MGPTTLILLQLDHDTYRPIALGVSGSYNRYGCIDYTEQHANNAILMSYFQNALEVGRFDVDSDSYPITNIEQLLSAIERHINAECEPAKLDGLPLTYAMICQPVWDAISGAYPSDGNHLRQFRQSFQGSSIPGEIYQGHMESVVDKIQEMAGVCEFLNGRQMAWKESDQLDWEYREHLRGARQEFSDSPIILRALGEYEFLISDREF